jgi:diaminohydroxyphosphoribosylaminopyrimidine deaminase / 5-amino-6-(5-phosphoribosylamino)uracil reductase
LKRKRIRDELHQLQMTIDHSIYMQRCLQLAKNAFGLTRSNPMVGCVVAHEGKIVSEGFHRGYGLPHAEVEALLNVNDPAILSSAIVYVNLEPCSHTGKTPPCTDFLIAKGIKNVVVASVDPNPLVSGSGIKQLEATGVNVVTGILDKENRELNKRFFTFYEKKRPYIILKWAQSKDEFIAPIDHKGSFKLTNSLSNILVHQWRSQEMGILVGRKTVENDDPSLTVRNIEGENPVRIVLDPSNKLKSDFAVFNAHAPTWVFNTVEENVKGSTEWIKIAKDDFLNAVFSNLHKRNILSVLVEGGESTLSSIIAQGLWDESRIFRTTKVLDKGISSPVIKGKKIGSTFIGDDELINLIQL